MVWGGGSGGVVHIRVSYLSGAAGSREGTIEEDTEEERGSRQRTAARSGVLLVAGTDGSLLSLILGPPLEWGGGGGRGRKDH